MFFDVFSCKQLKKVIFSPVPIFLNILDVLLLPGDNKIIYPHLVKTHKSKNWKILGNIKTWVGKIGDWGNNKTRAEGARNFFETFWAVYKGKTSKNSLKNQPIWVRESRKY